MSVNETPVSYAGAKSEVLDLIAAESDKRISAQVQVMLANDQRATGILAAGATLAAGAFAIAGSQLGKDGHPALLAASAVFAIFTCGVCVATVSALLPVSINVPGWSPKLFLPDIADKKEKTIIISEMVEFNQEKIDENDKIAEQLSEKIRFAMRLLAFSPVFAGVALLISGLWKG